MNPETWQKFGARYASQALKAKARAEEILPAHDLAQAKTNAAGLVAAAERHARAIERCNESIVTADSLCTIYNGKPEHDDASRLCQAVYKALLKERPALKRREAMRMAYDALSKVTGSASERAAKMLLAVDLA